METETHFVDTENHLYLKLKLIYSKSQNQIVGFKVVCWERVVECHLDDAKENNPIFKVRKLET